MVRLFERYIKRKIILLDGVWRFKTDPDKKGIDEKWFEKFPEDAASVIVPSCWNNELGLYDYEGTAWYAAAFRTSSENLYLSFEAVTGQAEAYLDGKHLGGHYGSFTGFGFCVEDLRPGEHMLVLCVDNTHNDTDTIPLARVDWYHYGGITGSIEIMELGKCWIKDCHIDYVLDDSLKNAKLNFTVDVKSLADGVWEGILNIYINRERICRRDISLETNATVKIDGYTLNGVCLWDIEAPSLYSVKFELETGGNVVDDMIERIGFRSVKAENRKLLLNGRELRLKGINRHAEHPDWGFAIPAKLMKKDVDIINEMGCNAIRGSHYPNSQTFLDYCDQEGLLFLEEIPMWQYSDRHFKNPLVIERGLKMIEEMVTRHRHHPSIIIWGVHNEVETYCRSAYEATKNFVERVKALDPSRLVTYATSRPMEDICLGLVDVISVNKYYGWYEGNMESWAAFLEKFKERLDNEGLSHKPVIISEFGAGAIYGEHTLEGSKWTENYQEKYLDFTLNLLLNDADISGVYIWQYCDIRSSKELEMLRPRSFNNKGILNEYRKPKLAYWTVRRIYRHR